MIGRRPHAAFGNSTGDRQMLEYTGAGDGARLMMLVLHDDAQREYAYGPAQGLPDTKVGTFTQALYDEAKKDGWTVISMKNDWKRIFAFVAASFPPPAHLCVKCPDFGQFGSCGSALPTDRRLPTSILRTSRNGKCP